MPLVQTDKVFIAPYIRALDTNGDGTGLTNGVGNYAAGAIELKYTPPTGRLFQLTALFASLITKANLTSTGYGGLAAALTNGVILRIQTLGRMIDTYTFKQNYDYQLLATNYSVTNYTAGKDGLKVGFAYDDIRASGLVLDGNQGDYVSFTLNDDFTSLDQHEFSIAGGILKF